MSININGVFHIGETWIIQGFARDEDGDPLDLTGATVQLRIVTTRPNAVILDLGTPNDGQINIPTTNGSYTFLITPNQQLAMTLTSYLYEVRVTLNDGTISVQNTGEITVKPSKFISFP
jgi:hypothetical protein